jgi:hypothetical protein
MQRPDERQQLGPWSPSSGWRLERIGGLNTLTQELDPRIAAST